MEEAFSKMCIGERSPGETRSTTKSKDETQKCHWKFLEHKGPVFPPPYKRLEDVKFKYDGEIIELSEVAEEYAVIYALRMNYLCAQDELFKKNFLADWQELMTTEQRDKIKDLSKCNFDEILAYVTERNKNEDHDVELNSSQESHKYCTIDDNLKVKILNCNVENPDLLCPTGENANMGKIKKRIQPEEVIINCSVDSIRPQPPEGRNWKMVIHDPTKAWIASWKDEVQNKNKYIYLDSSSITKQNIFRAKCETARELNSNIGDIVEKYRNDWKAKDLESRERGVVFYLMDTLALRPGQKKHEQIAPTTGCCTLKCEHIELCDNNYVQFDFLGKAGVRYDKKVKIDEQVYQLLKSFKEGKEKDAPLFNIINESKLNKYLKSLDLMPILTAKVFRTHRANVALEELLNKFTGEAHTKEEKYAACKKAILEVAKLCNHKDTEKKIQSPQRANRGVDQEYNTNSTLDEYIDPRIIIAWCKRNDIPIDEIYNNTLRAKFQWAEKEIGDDNLNFVFCKYDTKKKPKDNTI